MIRRARSAGAAAMELEPRVEALTRRRLAMSMRRLKLARKSAPMMGVETSATMKSHLYLLPAKDSCRVL